MATGNRHQMSLPTWCQASPDSTLEVRSFCSWEKVSVAQIPRTRWPPVFGPFVDNESHTGCFSMCNRQILSRELDPSPRFQGTLQILVHCSWEGLGQKLRAPGSSVRPTPSLSLLLHVHLPFPTTVLQIPWPPPVARTPVLSRLQSGIVTFV